MIEAGPLRWRNGLRKSAPVPWLALSISTVLAAGGALVVVAAVPYSHPAEPTLRISKPIFAEGVRTHERPKPLDQTKEYVLGEEGWSYERFGDDVVILRAAVTDPRGSAETGLFVISCEGRVRSLRIRLAELSQVRNEEVEATFHARAARANMVEARGRIDRGLLNAGEFSSDLVELMKRSPEGMEMLIDKTGKGFSFTLRNVQSALSAMKEFQRSCSP